tara:strand:- start:6673 stop:8223 length:1551 start_codon:yes stop_codon:yes gene_type:complete
MGNKINTYGSILDQVIGTKLNKFLAPQQNQGGLLNFVKSPYAADIGMGLLAQSGYSTMPTSLGQSLGVAMNQANQLRSQRRANDIAELGTLVNLRGALQDPERKIITGADGFQYYADTGERVLPNVKAPVNTSFKEYFSIADGSSKILDENSPTFLQDVEGFTSVEPKYKPLSDNYIKTENGLFDLRTQEIVKGTEPTVDRQEKDDYIKTDNGLFHVPTQKIVEGTQKVPENFRLLTDEEKINRGLEVDKPYQINTKTDKVSGLSNGQTIQIGDTYQAKEGLERYKNQLKIVGEDREKVSNWSKERGAINRIELGLENFSSGQFSDARSFIGGVIKLFDPDADLPNIIGEGGAIAKSGINEFKRSLFDGLQNLNQQEVQTIADILPSIGITPYANDVIIGALKIDNTASELIDNEGRDFEAGIIDYKTYTKNVSKIKKDANKQYREFYESSKTINTALEKSIKEDVGTPVTGFDVNGNLIQMQVEASDVWTGQKDVNGNPIIKKITGEFYAVDLEQ